MVAVIEIDFDDDFEAWRRAREVYPLTQAPREGPTTAYWEHFPHEADIGVRGVGPSEAAAFEQAALALTAVLVEPATVRAARAVPIRCAAPDHELLLVDWLNALVYEMAVQGVLFSRFEVTLAEHGLSATAWGEPYDPTRHSAAVEVKGATYTGLAVYREGGRWVAECVVDV